MKKKVFIINNSKIKLIIVGTGIQLGQMTIQSENVIKSANKVLYLVYDTIIESYIKKLNQNCESLIKFYKPSIDRSIVYNNIVNHIMSFLDQEIYLCVAFYGHPGVFTFPSHKCIELAKAKGINAIMLPAVSADACMYADLGIDPGRKGSQNFEVTYFLKNKINFNSSAFLILWQIGVIGYYSVENEPKEGHLNKLKHFLLKSYPPSHPIVYYEASSNILISSIIIKSSLNELDKTDFPKKSTLLIYPLENKF